MAKAGGKAQRKAEEQAKQRAEQLRNDLKISVVADLKASLNKAFAADEEKDKLRGIAAKQLETMAGEMRDADLNAGKKDGKDGKPGDALMSVAMLAARDGTEAAKKQTGIILRRARDAVGIEMTPAVLKTKPTQEQLRIAAQRSALQAAWGLLIATYKVNAAIVKDRRKPQGAIVWNEKERCWEAPLTILWDSIAPEKGETGRKWKLTEISEDTLKRISKPHCIRRAGYNYPLGSADDGTHNLKLTYDVVQRAGGRQGTTRDSRKGGKGAKDEAALIEGITALAETDKLPETMADGGKDRETLAALVRWCVNHARPLVVAELNDRKRREDEEKRAKKAAATGGEPIKAAGKNGNGAAGNGKAGAAADKPEGDAGKAENGQPQG